MIDWGQTRRALLALTCATAATFGAVAASAQTVLTSKDGSLSIEGELIGVDAENFYINNGFGELTLSREMVDCSGEGCPEELEGDQVVLQSYDGTIRLEGTLQDATETDYVLQTAQGVLTVRRELVSCEGPSCPGANDAVNNSVILASLDGALKLEGDLLEITDENYVLRTANGDLIVRRELVSCEGERCPAEEEVLSIETIAMGAPTETGIDLVRAIAEAFTGAKGLTVTYSSTGENAENLVLGTPTGVQIAAIDAFEMEAEQAISALLNGELNFAITREPATPEMLSRITGRQVNATAEVLFERVMALDALSVVTHRTNPIDTISIETLADIMTGRVTDWSEIGGPDGAITFYGLEPGNELMKLARGRVMGNPDAQIANYTVVESSEALADAVAGDRRGMAIVYRSQQGDLRPLDLASTCDIYYGSSDFAVQTQEYPFALGWYIYIRRDDPSTEFRQNLLGFLTTNEGQRSLTSIGLLSQQLRMQPMKEQGGRVLTSVLTSAGDRTAQQAVGEYFDQIRESRRLSTSLRFQSGSSRPDQRAMADIARISAIVRDPAYANYTVKLVGFSDSVGEFGANLTLSAGRASAIAELLLRENAGWLTPENVRVFGVGPIAPVACNTTPEGRELNRRVEVWLAPPAR